MKTLGILLALTLFPMIAAAQTDEIQVYDAEIAEPGVVNLMWHQNFTPDGVKTPAFPGAIISDKSYNGVPEFAFGITPWFEQGLYIPVYSISKGKGSTLDEIEKMVTDLDVDYTTTPINVTLPVKQTSGAALTLGGGTGTTPNGKPFGALGSS